MKKVLIFGTFDIIHPGHLHVFQLAHKYGEVHACLALDETVKKIKEAPPYYSLNERVQQLQRYNIQAHPGDAVDRLTVVKNLKPDVIVLGYDQNIFVDTLEKYRNSGEQGFEIIRAPSYKSNIFKSRKIRLVLEDDRAGFILVDKPAGEGSMRTVIVLRKVLNMKRVGFAGTLDPIASGLLACGTSSATALLDWWHLFPKTYELSIKLGVVSESYDSETEEKYVSNVRPSMEEIKKITRAFVGTSMQEPPMYSAKKVKGERLYSIAREGRSITREKQEIVVHSAEVLSYAYPVVRLRISCSTGTYMRSIVHDIGEQLTSGAIMTELRRTAIGPYSVKKSPKLEGINRDNVKSYFIDVDEFRDTIASLLFPEFDQRS